MADLPDHLDVLADELLRLCRPVPSYGSDRARWERDARGVSARIFRLGTVSGWDKAVAAADGSGLEHVIPASLAVRAREAIEAMGDDAPLALKQLQGHLLPDEIPREPGPAGPALVRQGEVALLAEQLTEAVSAIARLRQRLGRGGYPRRVALAELSQAGECLDSAVAGLREG